MPDKKHSLKLELTASVPCLRDRYCLGSVRSAWAENGGWGLGWGALRWRRQARAPSLGVLCGGKGRCCRSGRHATQPFDTAQAPDIESAGDCNHESALYQMSSSSEAQL